MEADLKIKILYKNIKKSDILYFIKYKSKKKYACIKYSFTMASKIIFMLSLTF